MIWLNNLKIQKNNYRDFNSLPKSNVVEFILNCNKKEKKKYKNSSD